MDQPTNLDITIKGKSTDVKHAALAAQRRIHLNTRGFKEEEYIFGDGDDFEEKMKDAVEPLGKYSFDENEDGTAEYHTKQESYACIWQEDIEGITNDIVKASPNVEIHMTAVITITYEEGYDLCVDVDYVDGEMNVNVSEQYYYYDDDEDYEVECRRNFPIDEFVKLFKVNGEQDDIEDAYNQVIDLLIHNSVDVGFPDITSVLEDTDCESSLTDEEIDIVLESICELF